MVIELVRSWIAAHPGAIGHIAFAVPRAVLAPFEDAFGEEREPEPVVVTPTEAEEDDEDDFDPNDLPEGITFRS